MDKLRHKVLAIVIAAVAVVNFACAKQTLTEDELSEDEQITDNGEYDYVDQGNVQADALVLEEEEQVIYNLVYDYIDQGNAKAAALVLAEEEQTDAVFALLHKQHPEMWDVVLLEAMSHFDEDGDLFHMMLLREKGYISDDVFGDYREQRGLKRTPADTKHPVDAYLIDELVRVYERGGESRYILIDLRYWGFIDEEMHVALVERLDLDYTDDVDMSTYVPRTAYLISGEELIQYIEIKKLIDEGNGVAVTKLMLQGNMSDELYAYMRKNDGESLDLVMAESLIAYAEEGNDEYIIQLCADGFISDRCFNYYWEMAGCELPNGLRTDVRYEGIDMYLIHEIKMMLEHNRQDQEFIKTLWTSETLDDITKKFIVNYFGGWE